MSKTHNYTNPSEKQDLGHVEASVTKGKKYYDEQGWEISAPISDAECIYKCLENCEQMAGLDRNQVRRLMDEIIEPPKIFVNRLCEDFKIERSKETLQSEYPPL